MKLRWLTIDVKLKLLEVRVPWLPFRARAMWVPFIGAILYTPPVWEDKCIQVHERYHVIDHYRWGVLPWLVMYALGQVYLAITGKPNSQHFLERGAYRRQKACQDAQDTQENGGE